MAEPDRGDRLAGVLTLIRRHVQRHDGDQGDDLSGALTLMRQQLADDAERAAERAARNA